MDHITEHDQEEVSVDISLMNLVNNHMRHASQPSLELTEQHTNCNQSEVGIFSVNQSEFILPVQNMIAPYGLGNTDSNLTL